VDLAKYIDLYLNDGREHVGALRAGLSAKHLTEDTVNELFRHAHSIKGMAASMGFERTAALAHAMEDLFSLWRQGAKAAEPAIAACSRALDLMDAHMDAVAATGSEAAEDQVARDCAAALKREAGASAQGQPGGRTASAPSPAPASGRETGGRGAGEGAPSPPSTPQATIYVSIDPTSALPAARLLVVSQFLEKAFGACAMEPPLRDIQSRNLKRAKFLVPWRDGAKGKVRLLRDLPEVREVVLETKPAGASASASDNLAAHVRITAKELDAFLSNAAGLLHHLNFLEAGLSREERRRHRFWLERHRAMLGQLFGQVLTARLVPFSLVTERLARLVRDLSERTGKVLRFDVIGADEEVDRALLERLADPLSHLLRNAADHGIESASERVAAGKPEEGLLSLEIRRDGEALLISVSDDGRGLDAEAIGKAAVERGLISAAEAARLPRERMLELITLPAFSTRNSVSEISGRGVGMDVVRSAAEALGGGLEMDSSQGKGTRFTLVIPSAATLTQVLVFGWEGLPRFGIPTSQVRHIYPLSAYPLVWAGARRCLQDGETLIPVLGWRLGPVGKEGCGLAVAGPSGERVILASEVFESERVVIHPWGSPLGQIRHWVGGALLSNGEIAYVVDGRALCRDEEQHGGQEAGNVPDAG
jgi:two-component system chemotaxis sensor kinase CheA